MSFWHAVADGVVVAVRAQPRPRRPGVMGVVMDASGRARLRIAVAAPPEDGRATGAVMRILAQALDVPAAQVTLRAGAASREKLLHVAGAPEELGARLDAVGKERGS